MTTTFDVIIETDLFIEKGDALALQMGKAEADFLYFESLDYERHQLLASIVEAYNYLLLANRPVILREVAEDLAYFLDPVTRDREPPNGSIANPERELALRIVADFAQHLGKYEWVDLVSEEEEKEFLSRYWKPA